MATSKKRLRILHIILAVRETSAPYNEHCLPWAEKREVAICSYFRSDIATPPTISMYEGDGSLLGFIRSLNAALRDREYDVVHVHSPHLGLLFLLATLFSSRSVRRSTVITVHDSYQNFKLRNKLMFIPVFAFFRKVICCGLSSYDSFPALYKYLAGDRLSYVPNGLDVDRVDRIAAVTQRSPNSKAALTAVTISRLVEIKNPFSVLRAFQESQIPFGHLVVIGDGVLMSSLRQNSLALGIADRVQFTGLIPREKVFEYLLDADLYISASRGEGLPVSVLEAMACGRPVVLSDIPPHREIAASVDFIPLVEPDDPAGFAREIRRFAEMNSAERLEVGAACRRLVEERFSLSAMHAGYTSVYSDILGNGNSILQERIA